MVKTNTKRKVLLLLSQMWKLRNQGIKQFTQSLVVFKLLGQKSEHKQACKVIQENENSLIYSVARIVDVFFLF